MSLYKLYKNTLLELVLRHSDYHTFLTCKLVSKTMNRLCKKVEPDHLKSKYQRENKKTEYILLWNQERVLKCRYFKVESWDIGGWYSATTFVINVKVPEGRIEFVFGNHRIEKSVFLYPLDDGPKKLLRAVEDYQTLCDGLIVFPKQSKLLCQKMLWKGIKYGVINSKLAIWFDNPDIKGIKIESKFGK